MMEKTIINVPEGTRYLSELVGRELPDGLPRGIFNKSICDCGATTIALTDEHKTILCSPRVKLLENKRDWCEKNGYEVIVVKQGVRDREIRSYMEHTATPKILVTYDSLPRVCRQVGDWNDWRVVVDEFHVLLRDSGFKSETELRTLDCLRGFPYVTYLSATPMLDEFVSQVDQFKDLPYTELRWQKPRKVMVQRIKTGKPMDAALHIINSYVSGKGIQREINGVVEHSKECVIFFNSVKGIVNLVANSGLTPEQVNIIVADTEENAKLVKKLGKEYAIGRIPLKDEPHKLVTLCTSTVYAGCDFWSKSAATFVICDSTSKNQIVDIGVELMQIAGRQRDPDNKFRDVIFFVYKTSPAEMREGLFRAMIDKKLRDTVEYQKAYEAASDNFKAILKKQLETTQRIEKYSDHYSMWDEEQGNIRMNYMAYLYDKYAYQLQKMFENGIVVGNRLSTNGFDIESEELCAHSFAESVSTIIKPMTFEQKMKDYCELRKNEQGKLSFSLESLETRDP